MTSALLWEQTHRAAGERAYDVTSHRTPVKRPVGDIQSRSLAVVQSSTHQRSVSRFWPES